MEVEVEEWAQTDSQSNPNVDKIPNEGKKLRNTLTEKENWNPSLQIESLTRRVDLATLSDTSKVSLRARKEYAALTSQVAISNEGRGG